MGLFGFEIKRSAPKLQVQGTDFERRTLHRQAIMAAAPNLPLKRGADQPVIEILPPFGQNPPTGPVVTGDGNLQDRLVSSDPRELWYLSLPSKLNPRQVLQILRSALGGDIWQQAQLNFLMLDSWPMYRKCTHELFEPVSNTKFNVRPYCPEGTEPTDSARDKADLVSRAITNFHPNQFSDEKGWQGLVYNACDAVMNGIAMVELIYHPVTDWGAGPERLPRASAWTHPRHFTFTNDGQVAIFDKDYNRLYFPLVGSPSMASPDPRKFVCAQFLSRSGSALGCGFMRPLAWYFAAVVFNREWMMKAAQNYGSPFVDVTYKSGMLKQDLDQLDREIAAGLANRWIRHVEGTVINVHDGKSTGSDNSQRHLSEEADKACCELLLGTEATTKQTPGKLGGAQNNSPQDKTKRERVEGVAKWISSEVLYHFAEAILYANYGLKPESLTECPTIEPDFTAAVDPMAQAQRDQVFLTADVPMVMDEFYKSNNLTAPEPGDLVVKGGSVGYFLVKPPGGDPSIPVIGLPVVAPEPKLGPDGKPLPPPKTDGGEPQGGDESATAAMTLGGIHRLVIKATDAELADLVPIVEAAEKASHQNGEHAELTKRLMAMGRRGA